MPRFSQRRFGVVGEIGIALHADEAVGLAGSIVDRAQHIGGTADVGEGEVVEHGADLDRTGSEQRANFVVIFVRMAHRLFEDGGIGGHPLDAVLMHQLGEIAAAHQAAPEIVEPGRLAVFSKFFKGVHHQLRT